jgi:hypothetical protein
VNNALERKTFPLSAVRSQIGAAHELKGLLSNEVLPLDGLSKVEIGENGAKIFEVK